MKMTLDEIMRIRHGGDEFLNGGIYFDGDKFFRTRTNLGYSFFGLFERGRKLPVEEWEEIEVVDKKPFKKTLCIGGDIMRIGD